MDIGYIGHYQVKVQKAQRYLDQLSDDWMR